MELDARGAAFAPRPRSFKTITWEGHDYEIRPTTLAFQRAMSASRADNTLKGVDVIIECTFWPPGTEKAGQRMFNDKDKDQILKSYGDEGSLWATILKAAGTMAEAARAPAAVDEEVGNSEASPSSTPS